MSGVYRTCTGWCHANTVLLHSTYVSTSPHRQFTYSFDSIPPYPSDFLQAFYDTAVPPDTVTSYELDHGTHPRFPATITTSAIGTFLLTKQSATVARKSLFLFLSRHDISRGKYRSILLHVPPLILPSAIALSIVSKLARISPPADKVSPATALLNKNTANSTPIDLSHPNTSAFPQCCYPWVLPTDIWNVVFRYTPRHNSQKCQFSTIFATKPLTNNPWITCCQRHPTNEAIFPPHLRNSSCNA